MTPSTTNSLRREGHRRSGHDRLPPAVVTPVIDAVSHLGVNHIEKPASRQAGGDAIKDAQGGVRQDPGTFEYAEGRVVDHAIELLGGADDAEDPGRWAPSLFL